MSLHVTQVDPKDAQTAALKREVQLLRAENTYLRGQLSSTASSGSSADLQTGLVRSGSKLTDVPPQPLTASTAAASKSAPAEVRRQLLSVMSAHDPRLDSIDVQYTAVARTLRSGMMQAAISTVQRLEAAEVMLARYGHENERLAAINEALVSRRAFVDSDYTSELHSQDHSVPPDSQPAPQGRARRHA